MRLPDQAARDRIRTDLNVNLVVEAAAGTGKTTALVNRLLEILATGTGRVEGLVAVTFTERAAGDLKLRLRSRLEKERTAAVGDRRENLERALAHLEEARINTIHGFCSELLRERPVEAQLDPLFTTLTDGAARRLFAQAFDLWFQQQLADPPEGIRRALRRVPSRWERRGPVERLREAARRLAETREHPAPWTRQPWDGEQGTTWLRRALRELVALLRQCEHPLTDELYGHLKVCVATEEGLERQEEFDGTVHPDLIEAALVELFSHIRYTKQGGAKLSFGPGLVRKDVWEVFKPLRDGLTDFVKAADADLAACLHAELAGAVDAYEALKRRQGKLDFHDLLLSARRLLLSDVQTRKDLQGTVSHLFIDEFQDTDPLQAEILLLLASGDPQVTDWRKVHVTPGKLFVVADPKQSIYRFRGADVGVYQEVKRRLVEQGAAELTLAASFRGRPNLQKAVNLAYSRVMTGEEASLQAHYVALEPVRADTEQPSVVVLPVPSPYDAKGKYAKPVIRASEPQVVANYLDWLLHQSGYTVGDEGRPLQPSDICILLKQFVNFGADLVGDYARALEARGIPHLLVGGRGYHDRGEVAGLVAVLTAIEWPDDQLSVFAALRGPLMMFDDVHLLDYHQLAGRFHPFEIPAELPAELGEIGQALEFLAQLHRERNQVSVGTTLSRLLSHTRAHVGFILRPSGEQVLANVLRLQSLAHAYEAEGGLSFRGFVEGLIEDQELRQEGEAPILEEGSPGVRLITAHSSKGLEFPVVVLADQGANLADQAHRIKSAVDGSLHAFQISTWAPHELLALREREAAILKAETVRLGYVAATRAQDLLVLTGLGDHAEPDGWYAPLATALHARGRQPLEVPPGFGRDSVLERPDAAAMDSNPTRPGLHELEGGARVLWWDPQLLTEVKVPPGGLRSVEMMNEGDPAQTELDLDRYDQWQASHRQALETASRPTRRVVPAVSAGGAGEGVSVLSIGSGPPRGLAYGRLVHALLSSLREPAELPAAAQLYARHFRLGERDVECAVAACRAVYEHELWGRVQGARQVRRETPLTLVDGEILIEGVLDLAFEDEEGWTVVDFKTDLSGGAPQAAYERQVALYVEALRRATGRPVRGLLVGV